MNAARHLYPAHDALRIGTVIEVDLEHALCRVRMGEEDGEGADALESHWMPWATARAGTTRVWSPPSVGEQVIVFSPDGDLASGFILGALFCDAHAEPGNTLRELIIFDDGAVIAYDQQAHHLEAILPGGGQATITAPGGTTINGPLTVNGLTTVNADVQVNGTATASTDVVGGGKSLKGHKHTGVQAGGAVSGAPQ